MKKHSSFDAIKDHMLTRGCNEAVRAELHDDLEMMVRRADTVRDYLVSHGIDGNRMRTISYGKERPVAVCNDISCWSQNRRVVTVLNASS